MDNKDDILNELREITPLADQFTGENPFTLPAGYFSGLPASIMARIKENSEAAETGFPELPVRAINPGKSQSAGLGENSMQGTVPLTTAVDRKKTGWPAGSSGVAQSGRKFLLRITMAAAMAGMLALGGWWYFNTSPGGSNQIKTGNKIAKAGNQITAADSMFLQKMRSMGEAEILGFIESSAIPAIYGYMASSSRIKEDSAIEIGDEDIKWMLAEVSETELQRFLEDDGDILYN